MLLAAAITHDWALLGHANRWDLTVVFSEPPNSVAFLSCERGNILKIEEPQCREMTAGEQ